MCIHFVQNEIDNRKVTSKITTKIATLPLKNRNKKNTMYKSTHGADKIGLTIVR